MPREFEDTVHDPLNYCCQEPQGRRRGTKTGNGRREWKDGFENFKNHRDFKLQNFPSHDCPFQNFTKDMRLAAASDQQLEAELQPRKFRKHKSRSPLTFPRNRKHPLDPYSHDFEPPELPHCAERCPGKSLEKSSKKKKEEMSYDCVETIPEENEIMRPDTRRNRKDKGKLRAQRCLNELEDLKDEVCCFEQEKRFTDQRKRNPLNSKMCPRTPQDDSDLDNEEEEENKRLERDLARISICEPWTHSKRIVKTPETTTSATETSIVEEMEGRGQRNARDCPLNDKKRLQQTRDDSVSSEASASEDDEDRDDTLRASPHIDENSPHYIDYLRNLRWRYINLIQTDLNRLYKFERFLESVTDENSKSGDARGAEKGRPVTRAPVLR
ncbi:uncharacterized protein LOC107036960 [Diachasma alloeum]|uniref:uncharacterized protein LOC107036960 n=1 Tax=Diachasma alloeum TaxID=454923 RepID=UPI0007383B33|nr:uncharacterized protein LOC107036960 [Diachasma alloeum]